MPLRVVCSGRFSGAVSALQPSAQVQIHCHLEDQTIAVIESKEDNSGLPQGTILKRGRVPKRPFDPEIDLPEELRQQQAAVAMTASKGGMEDTFGVVGRGGRVARKAPTTTSGAAGMLSKIGGGGAEEFVHYDWQDLLIGNEVQFYGRSYRIYNVDGFTRRWYAQAGIDQGPPEGVPTDPHGDKLEAETQRAGPKSRRGHNKQMYGVKEHMEAMRGKFVRDPRRRAQFQDFDGKVLRFDTIWDQRGQEGGDVAHYCLTYFLADDEVEVREMHATNNGKDPFPALLKKSPLPKQWQTAMDAGNDAVRHRPELFVRPADLRVGGTVDVYGRTLQIRAVDPFTRHFYSTVLRQPQPEARWEATQQHAPTEHVIPPHTGYGTEADSKLSVRYVRPLRGPKKNYNKWMVHDGQVFRWRARLVNKVPQDVVRRFSIAFFPSDDTMSVFEPPLRNTGVMGGKMLRRGEYKTNQGKEFDPATFVPGSTIVLAGNTFEILDADPFTRSTLPSVDEPAVEVYYANLTKSVPPTVTRQAELAELAAKEAEAEAAEDARRQEARELGRGGVQGERAREAELVTAAKQEVSKGSVPGMAVPANVPIPSMYATTNGSYGLPGF